MQDIGVVIVTTSRPKSGLFVSYSKLIVLFGSVKCPTGNLGFIVCLRNCTRRLLVPRWRGLGVARSVEWGINFPIGPSHRPDQPGTLVSSFVAPDPRCRLPDTTPAKFCGARFWLRQENEIWSPAQWLRRNTSAVLTVYRRSNEMSWC